MALPFSRKSLVVESLDRPQPRRAGKARDVLPLFVPFQYFLRDGTGELLVDPAMLLDAPHATFCLYHIRHVKGAGRCGVTSCGLRRACTGG